MHRRPELWLIALLFVASTLAGLAGALRAPSRDGRLSIQVADPGGAKGLAMALERLGVPVSSRMRPLYDLAADSPASGSDNMVVILDVPAYLAPGETRALSRFVRSGGDLLLASTNFVGPLGGASPTPAASEGAPVVLWVENCFGVRRDRVGQDSDDSSRLRKPPGTGVLPRIDFVLELMHPDSVGRLMERRERAIPSSATPCDPLLPATVDTLLSTIDGRPVAARLHFDDGAGRVTVVAAANLLTNRALKETDVGAVVLPWFLDPKPDTVVVDEYHHGFRRGGSILSAAWHWLWSNPAGWAVLQLTLTGLLALALAAIRFGPALSGIERRRRSSIEHLEALAAGLQRSGGGRTAVRLMIRGLQRRLGREEVTPRQGADRDWLDALARARPEVGASARHLSALAAFGANDEEVLDAALAVEEMWHALGRVN